MQERNNKSQTKKKQHIIYNVAEAKYISKQIKSKNKKKWKDKIWKKTRDVM